MSGGIIVVVLLSVLVHEISGGTVTKDTPNRLCGGSESTGFYIVVVVVALGGGIFLVVTFLLLL